MIYDVGFMMWDVAVLLLKSWQFLRAASFLFCRIPVCIFYLPVWNCVIDFMKICYDDLTRWYA